MVAFTTEFASPGKDCSPKTPIRDQVQLPGLRYYNPDLGRWVSRDPLWERGGRNLCAFLRNRPVDLIDPDGREACSFSQVGSSRWARRKVKSPFSCRRNFKDPVIEYDQVAMVPVSPNPPSFDIYSAYGYITYELVMYKEITERHETCVCKDGWFFGLGPLRFVWAAVPDRNKHSTRTKRAVFNTANRKLDKSELWVVGNAGDWGEDIGLDWWYDRLMEHLQEMSDQAAFGQVCPTFDTWEYN